MANTGDLRYIRTEEAIRTTFMKLVAVDSVATVTVSTLCRRAGISRNAFYLHYSGIPELYSALVDELIADVAAQSKASAERVHETGEMDSQLIPSLVDALVRHEELLRALLPADDGSLAKRLAEGIERSYVDAALVIGASGGSFVHKMNCAFAAWALVGLVVRWVAETERPLGDARGIYQSLQEGLSASATRFLTDEPAGASA